MNWYLLAIRLFTSKSPCALSSIPRDFWITFLNKDYFFVKKTKEKKRHAIAVLKMGSDFSSKPAPRPMVSTDLEGISTLDLKNLLDQLKDKKEAQKYVKRLKACKPVTNYLLQTIPCECKMLHKRPHHQFVKIVDPRKSLICIAAHLKVTDLTQDCILWLTPVDQKRVDRLFELLPDPNIHPHEQETK